MSSGGPAVCIRVVHTRNGRPVRGLHVQPGQVLELSYLHSRDVTFAVFCGGPYEESSSYRDFMGWEMPGTPRPRSRRTGCSPGVTSG